MAHSSKDRCGALSVEVALCLPLLFMLLFGCYEMARANMLLHATESAAYEGARVGIIPGATKEKITAAASQILHSVGISDFTVEVTPSTIERDTPVVEVTVKVPFSKNMALPAMFMKNPTFSGVCKLSREIP
ncbi:MAG: TadE/TadG family type IV pilus assembly protein [Planctomycetota bacterium]